MFEIVDELIQICGLSLIDIVLGQVTRRVQITTSPQKPVQAKKEQPLHQQSAKKIIPVVFSGAGLLVINKPAGLLAGHEKDKESVQTLLKEQFPQVAHDYYFAHRLDSATSGLLCIAKNKKKCSEVSRLFERRTVEQYYIAILRGHIDLLEINIDIPIGEDIRYKTSNNKMCTSHDWEHCLSPKRCETKLIVLERGFYDTEFATKVLLKPVTGRRHQLRVHCSQIDHPIIGDLTYSSQQLQKDYLVDPIPRMMLHAYRIKIPATSDPSLDLATEDPFKEYTGINWHPKEIIHFDLAEAFRRIDLI